MKNSWLKYLDEILKELLETTGDYVNEDIIAPKVTFKKHKTPIGDFITTYEGIPEDKERVIFRLAMRHLEKQDLIIMQAIDKNSPDYMITFEGLVVVKNGGLLKQRNNEKIKDFLQKIFWVIALLAFVVNTVFLILNYNVNVKKTYESNTQSVQSAEK